MELLRTLTLIHAGVLVLALAASLTAIWIELRRIAAALGGTRAALAMVEERTRPLDEGIRPFARDLERASRSLQDARARLAWADDRLNELPEPAGAGAGSGPHAEED